MKDPWFEGALILLCHHDEEGAMGLVVNKSCPISVSEVLEQVSLPGSTYSEQPALWGGPVGSGACFIIWKDSTLQSNEGWQLEGQISVSPSVEQLRSLVSSQTRFDIVVGYSGWGPGQLDKEIETGSWLYADIDPDLLFQAPLDERYDRAFENLGLSKMMVWMQPIDE